MSNKDPDIVTEGAPLIILDSKYAVCMAKNGKDAEHIMHISIKLHFVINDENCKMNWIEWCEGGLQLPDMANENVGENGLNPRMKYIMLIIDNRENTCKRGVTGERRACETRCFI